MGKYIREEKIEVYNYPHNSRLGYNNDISYNLLKKTDYIQGPQPCVLY